MSAIADFICRVRASELRDESDAALLGRFVVGRDEAAFTALVCRHGSMVYRVCRGVLRNEADAEDAAQATFLVLANKASRVAERESLPGWLHGVAFRTARKLRASIARRRAYETRPPDPPRATIGELTIGEAEELLHEQLEKLPGRYKWPLVLCYLQGKTHDEAAADLGWTVTVFRGRLERARKLLRDRLGRRGLALNVLPLVGILAEARHAQAATFAVRVARAAVSGPRMAVDLGLISPTALQMTQEALMSMSYSPLKLAASVLVMASLAASGWFAMTRNSAAPPAAEPKADAAPAAHSPDSLEKILVSCKMRLARLDPKRSGLTPIGDELGDAEFVAKHRTSPDGKSVAFSHRTRVGMVLELWKFDQRWPGKVLSTSPFNDFFWMPDGKRLLLARLGAVGKDGLPTEFEFQLLEVETLESVRLKLPEGHWPAAVFPDGKSFLTVKNVDAKDMATGARLYRVDRTTGKAKLLFDKVSIAFTPRWDVSPDGQRVAGLMLDGDRTLQVFVGDLGGRLRRVTRDDSPVGWFFGWSPSGKKLLYGVTRQPAKPKPGDGYHEIVVAIDADGRKRKELHDNEGRFTAKGQKLISDSLLWADWR